MFNDNASNVDKDGFIHEHALFSSLGNFKKDDQRTDERLYIRVAKSIFHLTDMVKSYKKNRAYTKNPPTI